MNIVAPWCENGCTPILRCTDLVSNYADELKRSESCAMLARMKSDHFETPQLFDSTSSDTMIHIWRVP